MRSKFDEQLEILNKEMITMGMLCENAISRCVESLMANDLALAGTLPELLDRINHKEREIESICLRLLLQQQPVAHDLRTISSALKMVTDMERVGDQSADIAEIICVGKIELSKESQYFQQMSAAVIKMVSDSLDAFVKKDTEIAEMVIQYDDIVDNYFNTLKESLINSLKEDSVNGESVLDQLMIAKYLERIGDHAVNVAKWVIFSITGVKYIEE